MNTSHYRELVEELLPTAEAFAARGEEQLAAQRARIAKQQRRGRGFVESARLLKNMETTQALHVQHVALLRRELERGDYGRPTRVTPPPEAADSLTDRLRCNSSACLAI